MIQVYDKNTGVMLGTITQEQLKFLVAQLEEESTTDQDYYIDAATIEMLVERQARIQSYDFFLQAGAAGDILEFRIDSNRL